MRLPPAITFLLSRAPAPDGPAGVWVTLAHMRRLAREGSRAAAIRGAAANIVFLQPAKHEWHEAESLFAFVRDSIRYTRDPVFFESVADPVKTLELGYGDCDDKTTLLAALLESVGYPTRFVVAGYQSEQYEHVYLQVLIGNEWIDCDPTEPQPFGWAPPNPVSIWFEKV